MSVERPVQSPGDEKLLLLHYGREWLAQFAGAEAVGPMRVETGLDGQETVVITVRVRDPAGQFAAGQAVDVTMQIVTGRLVMPTGLRARRAAGRTGRLDT
mgnify:CR=1 FL=1